MTRFSIALAAVAVSGLLGIGSAAAVPISNPASIVDQSASQIELVRQGCGVGFHRGPRGFCRRNIAPRGPWGRNACWWRGGVKICR